MMREVLRFLHILGAVGWVGSAFALHVLGRIMVRSGSDLRPLIRHGEAFGTRIFVPTALLTIASGIGLVLSGSVRFSDLWILLGIGGVVLSGVVQAVVSGPAERQLADNVSDPAVRRWLRGGVLDVATLVAVVAVMVLRPGA